jgi:Septum formation topological specificity factor
LLELAGTAHSHFPDVARNKNKAPRRHLREQAHGQVKRVFVDTEGSSPFSKYVVVQAQDVKVHLDREGDCEVLELNITLPETGDYGKTR